MPNRKQSFIRLCLDEEILRFGEFKLKSGRISPYFFNAGLFSSGRLLAALAAGYADLIAEQVLSGQGNFMLYGPAYKGIPLAAATAILLLDRHGIDIPYAFNRKEAKDHGEGGSIIGAPLAGDVIIIDDVITAGTSVGESVSVIQAAGATPSAVAIAVDRQERAGQDARSAVQDVESAYGIPVHAIIRLDDLISHLESEAGSEHLDSVVAYRARYGVS